MNIVELEIQGFLGANHMTIEANGKNVLLHGNNGSGKTTVINAIEALFNAASLRSSFGNNLINNDSEKASIEAVIGDYRVIRHIKKDKSGKEKVTLQVKDNKTGAKYSSPGKILEGFIGSLALDPGKFSLMPTAEAGMKLLKISGVNLDEIDNEIILKEEERRFSGRVYKEKIAAFESLEYDENWPHGPVSLGELTDRKIVASAIKSKNERAKLEFKDKSSRLHHELSSLKIKKQNIKSRIEQLNRQLLQEEKKEKELNDEILSLSQPVPEDFESIDQLDEKIAAAEKTNDNYHKFIAYEEAKERQAIAYKAYEKCELLLNEAREKRMGVIRNGNFPVSGMAVNDNGEVTLNDVPISNLSAGQKLLLGTYVCLAEQNKLKVIAITNADLMDSETLRKVRQAAAENDTQLFLEFVRRPEEKDQEVIVEIENGTTV